MLLNILVNGQVGNFLHNQCRQRETDITVNVAFSGRAHTRWHMLANIFFQGLDCFRLRIAHLGRMFEAGCMDQKMRQGDGFSETARDMQFTHLLREEPLANVCSSFGSTATHARGDRGC